MKSFDFQLTASAKQNDDVIFSVYLYACNQLEKSITIEMTWGETATKPAKFYHTRLIRKSLFRPHVH